MLGTENKTGPKEIRVINGMKTRAKVSRRMRLRLSSENLRDFERGWILGESWRMKRFNLQKEGKGHPCRRKA